MCDLIKRLLAWDPLTRMGCLTDGAADVKHHPFFGEISWEKLTDMELEPPHIPELRSTTDMSYFDDPTVEPAFLNGMVIGSRPKPHPHTPYPHLQVEPAFLNEPEYDYSANAWDIDF